MDPAVIGLLSVGAIIVLILLGMHVGIALAVVSLGGIWLLTGNPYVAISLPGTTAYRAVMDYVYVVIPLFVLMGLFATQSGATGELFDAAWVFFRKVRGGLGITTVLANAVFAAVTGVSVASAAVFSKIALPEMERHHYDPKFSLGIIASSSLLGMLIPPSVLFIVYAVLTEQSVGRLFIAGIVPGLLLMTILSLYIWLVATLFPQLGGSLPADERTDWKSLLQAALRPWAIVVLVLVVLGGIYGGLLTPTEAGAVGAAGAFLLVVAKRRLTLKGLGEALMDTGRTTASIFLLLITAQMYSRMLTLTGLPAQVSQWASQLSVGPLVVILIFVAIMLVLGAVLDSVSILLIAIPIMAPVAKSLGYDLTWFGVVAVVTIEIGLLTPPFGMVVFAMKSALGDRVTLEEIFAGAAPFLLVLGVCLALLIAFPSLSTWLPSLMDMRRMAAPGL